MIGLKGVAALFVCWVSVCAGADAPGFRDVLRSSHLYPFMTDADLGGRISDTEAEIVTDGGDVTVCYPGIVAVRAGGEELAVKARGVNWVRVAVPAGACWIQVVATETEHDAALPESRTGLDREAFMERVKGLKPGDDIVLRNGLYRDLRVFVDARGASGQPICIRAETPGGVILQGDSVVRLTGDHLVLKGFRFEHVGPGTAVHLRDANDCRVTQCQFFHCGSPVSTFAHIVRVDMESHRNRVDHCYWTGSKSMSLAQRITPRGTVGTGNRYDHNIFRDVYRYWVNGQENLQLGQNQRGASGDLVPAATVEFNLFDHAWGDSETISNKSSGNTIRYNVAAHCLRSAFTLRGGNDVRFEGNVMVNDAGGVIVMGMRHRIVNNLFIDIRGPGVELNRGHRNGESNVAAQGTLVAHNTCVRCAGPAVLAREPSGVFVTMPEHNTIVNNIFVGLGGPLLDLEHTVETRVFDNVFWTTEGAVAPLPASWGVAADPKLTGSGLMTRPAAGSPAVDRGRPLAAVPGDRWGQSRTVGGAPDLGCDEVGGVAPDARFVPAIPSPPLLDPDLYKEACVVPWISDGSWSGWRIEGTAETHEDGSMTLTDGTMHLREPAPDNVVLEWEYLPSAFDTRAAVYFGGYTVSWGGAAEDGKPAGLVTLSKDGVSEPLATGADVVQYRQDFQYQRWLDKTIREGDAPGERARYRFTVIRARGWIAVLLRSSRGWLVPVLQWQDRGIQGGPAPTAGETEFRQRGRGTWSEVSVWRCGYAGDVPPPAPADVTATAYGAGRVTVRWQLPRPGCTVDIWRSDAAGAHEDQIVQGVPGSVYEDFSVSANTPYVYRVRARNVFGGHSESVTARVKTGDGGPYYAYLPVSRVAGLVPPMKRETASGGGITFVSAPTGTAQALERAPETGHAQFAFVVPQDAEYHIWGMVESPNSGQDSFHAAVDRGAYSIWHTGLHESWGWSRFGQKELAEGRHVFTVKHREAGTRLAGILVTDDDDFGQ